MGIFAGIGNARPAFDANYVRPGRYLLRIDKVKQDKNRKGEDFVAVEVTVLHVKEQVSDAEGNLVSHRSGETPCWMQMVKHDGFLSRIKSFVSSLMGCSADEVGEAECDAMVLDDGSESSQPMAGMVAEATVREIESKKGQEIHQVSWVRRVPFSELKQSLPNDTIEKYYPGGKLDELAKQWGESV